MPTFSADQIGRSPVRFPSGVPIPSITDASTDPYARTRLPKEVQVEGLQVWPQQKGTFPGLVLLHEFWGLNAQIQAVADRLAREGYTVLIPNLYVRQGGVITANAEVAAALMARINAKDLLQDINSCCEFLNTRDHVKRNVYAVIGFGMGGGLAIEFACHRKRLRGAVSFYGKPAPTEVLNDLRCPLLYHRPGRDDRVSDAELERLRVTATTPGRKVVIKTYEQAGHAFFNETLKDAYNEDAAREAWDATVKFLNECFRADL